MKITAAKKIGFCSGVKRAVESAKKSLKEDLKPVYFLGEIVHNEKIIKETKKLGGIYIKNPGKAENGTLIIRTHGTAPFLPPKNTILRDLTCSLVKKAQNSAKFLFNQGYQVVIIGDKKHPEVKGIKGYAKNKAIIIENEAAAKKIKNFKKIGAVAQTTQNLEKVKKILKILKNKTKNLQWINTICPEVLSRQRELSRMLEKIDGVLIIGSETSANTGQLVKIAESAKKPFWRINSAKELKKDDFTGLPTLGIVSGTSAPDWIIEEIIDKLKTF